MSANSSLLKEISSSQYSVVIAGFKFTDIAMHLTSNKNRVKVSSNAMNAKENKRSRVRKSSNVPYVALLKEY